VVRAVFAASLLHLGVVGRNNTICTKAVQYQKKLHATSLDSRLSSCAQWRTLALSRDHN
jgi:hypothetical protein